MALLSLEDDEAQLLLADVPEEERGKCWWLVLRDGTLVPGDQGGGVALMRTLTLTRPLGPLLRPASRLVDALEALVARYRSRLGRLVPEGPAPRRYP